MVQDNNEQHGAGSLATMQVLQDVVKICQVKDLIKPACTKYSCYFCKLINHTAIPTLESTLLLLYSTSQATGFDTHNIDNNKSVFRNLYVDCQAF